MGLTDFLQVGTGVSRNFYQVYNLNAKASLLDRPDYAAAVVLGWESTNLKDIGVLNPDLRVQSWLPGAVFAVSPHPQLAIALGGKARISGVPASRLQGLATSGALRGAEVGTDVSVAYQPQANVISAGVSYDLTYHLFGVGLTHHWPGLHLGAHFYPAAARYRVQPLISGGLAFDL